MIKFQTIGLSSCRYDFSKSNAAGNQKTRLNYANTDTFIKQQEDISFGGFRKNKKVENRTEDNLASSLKHVSMKGTPFLLGLAASVAMVKMGKEAQELLCDEDGYSVDGNGVKSDLVNIDEKDGIIKFEGTGIEIDADKCDVADWENGIFRNYDGSIDIDLGNNKFIDTDNGIFVDPDANISAVLDGGHFENIAIPSFGSGYPTCPWDDRWQTMPDSSVHREKDARSALDKASEFLKDIFKDGSGADEAENTTDIFGNMIIKATDSNGDTYLTCRPDISKDPVFARFSSIIGNDEPAVEMYNNIRLRAYMDGKYPTFGTRVMVYEGGRNSWGGQMPSEESRYDTDEARGVLEKISRDGGYYPEPGSSEAISFLKFQNIMLREGVWDEPIIAPNLLLDTDGDFEPDVDLDGDNIPDYDTNEDGIIEMSSQDDKDNIIDSIKDFFAELFGGD